MFPISVRMTALSPSDYGYLWALLGLPALLDIPEPCSATKCGGDANVRLRQKGDPLAGGLNVKPCSQLGCKDVVCQDCAADKFSRDGRADLTPTHTQLAPTLSCCRQTMSPSCRGLRQPLPTLRRAAWPRRTLWRRNAPRLPCLRRKRASPACGRPEPVGPWQEGYKGAQR